jgi:hypothetical protein
VGWVADGVHLWQKRQISKWSPIVRDDGRQSGHSASRDRGRVKGTGGACTVCHKREAATRMATAAKTEAQRNMWPPASSTLYPLRSKHSLLQYAPSPFSCPRTGRTPSDRGCSPGTKRHWDAQLSWQARPGYCCCPQGWLQETCSSACPPAHNKHMHVYFS